MAKAYIGADNVSKLVKKMYIGVDGVARKVTKAYRGVDGVAKLVYSEATKKEYLYGGTSTFVHSAGSSLGVSPGTKYALESEGYVLQVEKYDTTPLYVYLDGELVATTTTSGEQSITIDNVVSRLVSNGTATVTVVSESEYGLGEQRCYQIWDDTTSSKSSDKKTVYGNITSGTLSDNVIKIYNNPFKYLTGSNISIPSEGLIELGSYALSNRDMVEFTIPNTVKFIGDYAFYNCGSLTSIDIPNGVTSIGNYAFYGCKLSSIEIPEGVTSIGSYAFYHFLGTSIELPDSLTSIGSNAFDSCPNITSIVIPRNVSSIGSGAFKQCSDLTSILIEEGNQHYVIRDGGLYDIGYTKLLGYPTKRTGGISIPVGVTSIDAYTFYECTGLTSIVIPDGMTTIGTYAFYKCTGLTSISLPEGVTSIGSYAFAQTNVKSIVFPSTMSSIPQSAFSECGQLVSAIFPSSIMSIGTTAFYLTGLKDITFKHTASDTLSISSNTNMATQNAFYSSVSKATNVYHNGNESVLNYAWAKCNRTVTFIEGA